MQKLKAVNGEGDVGRIYDPIMIVVHREHKLCAKLCGRNGKVHQCLPLLVVALRMGV